MPKGLDTKIFHKFAPYGNGEELMAAKPEQYPSSDQYSAYRAERDFINEFLFNERIWLFIPFSDRCEAKRLGFKWDSDIKKWWGTESLFESWPVGSKEMTLIEKWIKSNNANSKHRHD